MSIDLEMRMKGQWSEQNKTDQEKKSQVIIRNWWGFPAASVVPPWKWRDSLKLQMLILLPFSKSISSNSPFSNPLESPSECAFLPKSVSLPTLKWTVHPVEIFFLWEVGIFYGNLSLIEYSASFLNACGYGKCISAWLTWRFPQGCSLCLVW